MAKPVFQTENQSKGIMSEKSEGGGRGAGGGSKSYRRDREERRKGADRKSNEKRSEEKPSVSGSKDATVENADSGKSNKLTPSTSPPEEVNDNVEPSTEPATAVEEVDVIKIEEMAKEKERLEKEAIETYLADARARHDWKEGLRSANVEAEANRSDDDKQFYKLDSSLKKNTAFIKKCKTFSEGQKAALTKEMSGLNLTKYIGEVSSALVETKLKMSDITAMVEFCSALHQRYTEFSTCLLENWTKV